MQRKEKIVLPATEVAQSPDACVTACLQGVLSGLGISFSELENELKKYKVPIDRGNLTDNPSYFYSDGIILVLKNHGFYIAVHIGSKGDQKSEKYTGLFNELNLTPPDYSTQPFSIETFEEYLFNNLIRRRYLFIWLDNPLYSRERYEKNHYEEHVVCVWNKP